MKKILNILGDITSQPKLKTDVSLSMVMAEVEGLNKGDQIEVNINSYGGEVFEAVAIRHILTNSPASESFNILGLCASAANLLINESAPVDIAKGAMVMNHWAQGGAQGDAREHRRVANLLAKIDKEILLTTLNIRSSKSIEELSMLLDNEWWLSSDEAIQILGYRDAGVSAIENKAETRQIGVYKNYMERKKALSNNAYSIFINHKNNLK